MMRKIEVSIVLYITGDYLEVWINANSRYLTARGPLCPWREPCEPLILFYTFHPTIYLFSSSLIPLIPFYLSFSPPLFPLLVLCCFFSSFAREVVLQGLPWAPSFLGSSFDRASRKIACHAALSTQCTVRRDRLPCRKSDLCQWILSWGSLEFSGFKLHLCLLDSIYHSYICMYVSIHLD